MVSRECAEDRKGGREGQMAARAAAAVTFSRLVHNHVYSFLCANCDTAIIYLLVYRTCDEKMQLHISLTLNTHVLPSPTSHDGINW